MPKTRICSMCFAAILLIAISLIAEADTIWYDTDGFEEPNFIQGNLAGRDLWSGQDGWLITADSYHEANLDGIVVQDELVREGEQAVMFDASVQDFDYAHLRRNILFDILPEETHANIVMDFYIEDSDTRSEVWGLDIQCDITGRLTKWLVWNDNRLTVLDPNINDWVDTGFEFERDTWYNIQTSINFVSMVVDLIIDNELIYTVDVIDQINYHVFSSIYLGEPGNDKIYFDNFIIQSEFATGIEPNYDQIPYELSLKQNYPNPFNAQTIIEYELLRQSDISLEIIDILGKRVAVLEEGIQSAGNHKVNWNAKDVPSGVYFYRLRADNYTESKKMMLVK